ncbi:hypothetical protein Pint_01446 [Pistacia integerrima]|uniref:Uncharacterized protein n=1 Tax=Pistacia integerrima TaxID=434235 RepID=A0ACC0ZKH9_9ROSI|nr:hypothetical protein Pint_01446 [Pistacia integerrima]
MIQKGNQTVQEYLQTVKVLADEISFIDHPISEDDLTLYILNGLGSDFHEIATLIRAREKPLLFEELHDLLLIHDAYLRWLESTTQQLVTSANYSNHRSGSSSVQFTEPTANYAATSSAKDAKWLIDSGASHNITGDLENLSVHSEYDGLDEVAIGDGSGLHVSHIGSLVLKSPMRTFHLNDTLCVPNIRKNLISMHHFTSQNNVLVEFHPLFFLVKDRTTGAIILKGACENGVYTLP